MIDERLTDWAAARSEKWRRHLAGLEAMLAPIDEPLIRALNLGAPVRVADIGCGSGATTREVWRRAPAGSIAHGLDLSPALIEVARRRNPAQDGSLVFEVADVQHGLRPDLLYDRLVSRLGVMFFTDAAAAFMNLCRSLAPGGQIAFAVWGPIADNPWISEVRDTVAQVVDLPRIDPSAPGAFRYADPGPLLSVLARAGFANLGVIDFRQPLPIGGALSAAEAARFALAAFSSFAEMLTAAGPDAVDRASRMLTERLIGYERDGAVMMNARVHVITGDART